MVRIIFQSLICLIILSSFSPGEKPIRIKVMESLAGFNKTQPQEKAYLHFDKPYYHPRDTVWYKAYLVDAMHHLPDSASGVMYVDLLDEGHGKAISRQAIRVSFGFGSGMIDLPDSLPDGRYQIRAYTNWMRNFPGFFFTRTIHVYHDIDRSWDDEKLKVLTQVTHLEFFPEGGELVQGLTSRVAFKCTNITGRGIDGVGFILNSKNDTVVSFISTHLGMGYFSLKPAAGETYKAFVKTGKGNVNSFSFPTSIPQGFVMAVDNITRKDEIRIYISHNFPVSKNVTLIAHQRGTIRYAADIPEAKPAFVVRMPRANFPEDGIVHLTLFSDDGTPMSERLIFIKTDKELTVEIKTDKSEYNPREKVEVDILVKDASGNPVEGNFSLSATDNNQVMPEPFGENLYSYLLLQSDVSTQGSNKEIRGEIEQPGWYFDKANGSGPALLDILLMTQGWRRFIWSDLLKGAKPDTTHIIEFGLPLSGNMLQKNGQPVVLPTQFNLILKNENGASDFAQGMTEPGGNFSFNNLEFTGTTIIKAQAEKDKKVKFRYDSLSRHPVIRKDLPVDGPVVSNDVLKHFLLRERQNTENKFLQNKLLDPVLVKTDKLDPIDSRRNISPVADKKDVLTIDNSHCAGAVNALTLLLGKFAGVKIYKDANVWKAQMRGINTFGRGFGTTEPLYIVDGVPVEATFINSIYPCDVESVEVFKGPTAIWGSMGNNGVIAFFLRKNVPTAEEMAVTRQNMLVRIGFATPRQFYSPKYDKPTTAASALEDHRAVLFWEPQIITNREGKARILFWNSDEKETNIRIHLEGMSYRGRTGISSTSYTVH